MPHMEDDGNDNPFRPGGELSREAEEVLKRTTICNNNVIIQDTATAGTVDKDGVVTPTKVELQNATNQPGNGTDATNEPISGEVVAKHVEPFVAQAPGQVEHVTIEKSKKGCCSLQ